MSLHTLANPPPSGDAGAMVPVELITTGTGMVIVGNVFASVVVEVALVMDVVVVLVIVDIDDIEPVIDVDTVLGIVVVNGIEPTMDVDTVLGIVVIDGIEPVIEVETVPGIVDIDGIVPMVPPATDNDGSVTAGVPGTICPIGVEQVTTVPGSVGFKASGTGVSVVSGTPAWVVGENGLGPLMGDVRTVPGVVGRAIAVVPIVDTCA
jgi:hypothetical protein